MMRKSIYCIGERIRERRKEKCWTQKDLAQHVNTSYKYISHVENGVKFPSLEMLICIARELEVTLDYLISSELLPVQNTSDQIQQLLSDCTPEEYAFMTELLFSIHTGMEKHGIISAEKSQPSG